MKLKLEKSKILSYILVLTFFYPTLLSSLTTLIIPSAGVQLLINIFALILLIYLAFQKRVETKSPVFNILLALMIIIIIFGYVLVRDYEYVAQFRFIAFFTFSILAMRLNLWQSEIIDLLLFMGIIYSVTTIWLAFDSATYVNIVTNWYPSMRIRLLEFYRNFGNAGITDHYSTNGMVLANSIIAAWALFLSYKMKLPKRSKKYRIVFIIVLVALFLTTKRAHILFSLTAIIVSYLIATKREKRFVFRLIALIFIGVSSILFSYLFIPQVKIVIERFLVLTQDRSINSRIIFWSAALNAFETHKLFGIGWFGFRDIIAPTVSYTGHAHNVYVQLLCETGILGFSLFMIWFVSSLIIAIKINYKCYTLVDCLKIKSCILFSLCYQIYFLLYCFTGNPLYDIYQYPIYFVACIIPMFYTKNKVALLKKESSL
jgi:O-antigen ligase